MKPKLLSFFLIFISLLIIKNANAQQTNSCGLIAKMTPAGDSIAHGSINVQFTNSSINATDYKFLLNRTLEFLNTPLSLTIEEGLTKIELVAYNGNCTDTVTSYYFYSGTAPTDTNNTRWVYGNIDGVYATKGITHLTSGGYLLYGSRLINGNPIKTGMGALIKTSATGCPIWAKKTESSTFWAEVEVSLAKEAADGSIYIISKPQDEMPFISKLDVNGNIIWTKKLLTPDGVYESILSLEVTADGGFVCVSNADLNQTNLKFTRFDGSGNIIWQRQNFYNNAVTYPLKNLLIKDGFLYAGGGMFDQNFTGYSSYITKMDLNTGETVWFKKYLNGSESIRINELISMDSTIAVDLVTNSGDVLQTPIGAIMEIDTAGNVLLAKNIVEPYVPNNFRSAFITESSHLTKSGDDLYILTAGEYRLSLQGDGRASKLIRFNKNFEPLWISNMDGINRGRFYFNTTGKNGGVALAGISSSPALLTVLANQLLTIMEVDSSGTNFNANCYSYNQDIKILNIPITVVDVSWTVNQGGNSVTDNFALNWNNYYPEMRYNCPDYVDSCSFLKISGPASICNLTQEYTYKSHRNKACGQPTQWTTSANMQIVNQTDSSIKVRFNNFGTHVIYGKNLLGCAPVLDSILITVKSSSPALDLGTDYGICSSMTDTLCANTGFLNYLWQDGSSDSTFIVTQPGLYWVKVTDSCNNILRDSINITAISPLPFSAGGNREVCENDTLQLSATAGFSNYKWSPDYRLNTTNQQNIIAQPLKDTTYFITAVQQPGCFVYDSLKIKVFSKPEINLGIDTSICINDSLIIKVGPGFTNYIWNTGDTTEKIIAKNVGNYMVTATTTDGCIASDTLNIPFVFPLPQPKILGDNYVCTGGNTILNVSGNFNSYLWNSGSNMPQINASALGVYTVKVTDNNNCKATDTFQINSIKPLPVNFLKEEIIFCSYETARIQPLQNFQQYNWSTGSSLATIEVNQTGIYWLEVKDQFGCEGKDSIFIKEKNDCLNGVHIPSAFTPDNDGVNDKFKPLIFGKIKVYQFKIFDRYGKLVFESLNPDKGWDGKFAGLPQNGNAFVWILNYQLEGQQPKFEKGSVLLIR